jgi:hypothetical protein
MENVEKKKGGLLSERASFTSWEEILKNAPVNVISFIDTQSSSSCDAYGAHIETTLLKDLSEEERISLVEHSKTCSTCAERIWESQIIEEVAGQLLEYNLRSNKLEYMRLASKGRKWFPIDFRKKETVVCRMMGILLSTWWFAVLVVLKVVKQMETLLIRGVESIAGVCNREDS